MRDQFTFYRSFWEAIQDLKKADRQAVLEAIISYALNNIEPGLTGTPNAIFTLIRPVLDAAEKKSNGGKKKPRRKEDNGKTQGRYKKDNGKEKEGEIEKESLDSFSIENESSALAPDRPDGGGAARSTWGSGSYDPEFHEIVYKEFT